MQRQESPDLAEQHLDAAIRMSDANPAGPPPTTLAELEQGLRHQVSHLFSPRYALVSQNKGGFFFFFLNDDAN